MRNGTPPVLSIERALRVLDQIISDAGEHNLSELAVETGVPAASLHRIVKSLTRGGYLAAAGRGRYVAGSQLLATAAAVQPGRILAAFARTPLEELARRTGRIAHLGVLENDMVTYLVKAGRGGDQLFTREGMQLEAYCSGIGKILLAHLGESEREHYLADGPFVALTEATTTDPAILREELDRIRETGVALDNREVAVDLMCIAAPIRWPDGHVRAAISLSSITGDQASADFRHLAAIRSAADRIECVLGNWLSSNQRANGVPDH